MNLGENIYRLRIQKNMSQGDLADALEVSRQSVSKWENNAAVPELEKLEKLSRVFDVTLDELIYGEQTGQAEPAPSPVATQSGPMPKSRLIGIVLLACGLLSLIGLTLAGFFMDFILLGALVGFPLILNGIVCLVADRHTLFSVCWVNYILLFLFNFVFTMQTVDGSVNPSVVISIIMLAALVAWSIFKLYKGHFNAGRIAKVVWTVILALLLAVHLLLMMLPFLGGSRDMIEEYTEEECAYME